MNIACRPHALKGGLSVQAAVVEGRLTKSAGNSKNLMTEVYTLAFSNFVHIFYSQTCTTRQRMELLVLFWTKPILHRPPLCFFGANVHFPYKLYQAVWFYQSASVSGCSNGMHMFWISYHLALKSLRLPAGLALLVGLIAQHWPPRIASGTAALTPHPSAVERREETRRNWRLAYLTYIIKEHGIQVISNSRWKFNLPVKGLKNIKGKSALLNILVI